MAGIEYVDEDYIRTNVRSISMVNFYKLDANKLEVAELIAVLERMYSQIQNLWLQVMGHTPGREL